MGAISHKNERIRKAWNAGLTVPQIARRLGYQDEEQGVARVCEGLLRMGLISRERVDSRQWSRVF